MKNEEQLETVDEDVFDPNRGKKFRDELAQTLRENRKSAALSSGGRAEAKGRLDFEKKFDWRYDDAKKERAEELKKRSEAIARLVADFLKREKGIPNKDYRLNIGPCGKDPWVIWNSSVRTDSCRSVAPARTETVRFGRGDHAVLDL